MIDNVEGLGKIYVYTVVMQSMLKAETMKFSFKTRLVKVDLPGRKPFCSFEKIFLKEKDNWSNTKLSKTFPIAAVL